MDERVTSSDHADDNLIDFRILAEDGPVMLWITNNTGENIFSNGIYQTFIGRKKVVALGGGKAWFEALFPEDQKNCLSVFDEALKTHKSFVMEYRLKRHDGEYCLFY